MSCGTGSVDQRSFVVGASRSAVPEKIEVPSLLLAWQSKMIFFVASSLATTFTLTRMRSPTRMRFLKDRETLVSVQPGPGVFMLNRPDINEAHHILGPVGGMPPARFVCSSEFSTAWKPEMDANAIASSGVSTCSVDAASPIAISSYVLLSMNPRFILLLHARLTGVSQAIVCCSAGVQSDLNHRCSMGLSDGGDFKGFKMHPPASDPARRPCGQLRPDRQAFAHRQTGSQHIHPLADRPDSRGHLLSSSEAGGQRCEDTQLLRGSQRPTPP